MGWCAAPLRRPAGSERRCPGRRHCRSRSDAAPCRKQSRGREHLV